jgi:hypothetical protein
MSPPEVWGPPIWTLFHTLIEKLNEKYYNLIYPQLFNIIKQICKFLPCPECSNDATMFLSRIKIQALNTKSNFKNIMYLFHNYVNKKKRKPLFNFLNINIYKNKNLLLVIKNFINVYNTKGNMKLLTDSFQRQMIINNFRKWIVNNIGAFFETPQPTPTNKKEEVNEEINQEIIDAEEKIELPVSNNLDNLDNNTTNVEENVFNVDNVDNVSQENLLDTIEDNNNNIVIPEDIHVNTIKEEVSNDNSSEEEEEEHAEVEDTNIATNEEDYNVNPYEDSYDNRSEEENNIELIDEPDDVTHEQVSEEVLLEENNIELIDQPDDVTHEQVSEEVSLEEDNIELIDEPDDVTHEQVLEEVSLEEDNIELIDYHDDVMQEKESDYSSSEEDKNNDSNVFTIEKDDTIDSDIIE